jgi:hypothetical protein
MAALLSELIIKHRATTGERTSRCGSRGEIKPIFEGFPRTQPALGWTVKRDDFHFVHYAPDLVRRKRELSDWVIG